MHRGSLLLRVHANGPKKIEILIHARIISSEKFLSIKDGICPCKKTEGLPLSAQAIAPRR